jgi:hypothetical protein
LGYGLIRVLLLKGLVLIGIITPSVIILNLNFIVDALVGPYRKGISFPNRG